MTDINHRRKNKKSVNQRYGQFDYHNGYAHPDNKRHFSEVKAQLDEQKAHYMDIGMAHVVFSEPHTGSQRVGRTDFLDKSMHGWGRKSDLADRTISACIGNDFHKGHRGMAKAVKGAKKFVRTRTRFHENSATQKLTHENFDEN